MPGATTDQGISVPIGADAADNPVAFNNAVVSGIETRLVRRYADEADRTAKMAVLTENSVSALAAEDRVDIYTGAAHISLHTRALFKYSRVTADQLLTMSNTTLQNLTNLVVPVPGTSGAVFGFKAVLFYDTSTTADLKIAFTIPTGATMKWGVVGGLATAAGGTTGDGQWGVQTVSGTATPIGGAGVGTTVICVVEGELTMSTTAGDLQMQAAQNTSDATQSTVQIRSRIEAWRTA